MNTIISTLLVVFTTFLVWLIYQRGTGNPVSLVKIVEGIPYGDKLGHFLLFGSFTFLAILSSRFHRLQIRPKNFVYSVSVFIFVTLILEECSQIFLDTRTFEFLDICANTLGIVFFSLMAKMIEPFVNNKQLLADNKEST